MIEIHLGRKLYPSRERGRTLVHTLTTTWLSAKSNFISAGLEEWVEFRVGDAWETLEISHHSGARPPQCCACLHACVPRDTPSDGVGTPSAPSA